MKQWAIQQPALLTYEHLGVWLCSTKSVTNFLLKITMISDVGMWFTYHFFQPWMPPYGMHGFIKHLTLWQFVISYYGVDLEKNLSWSRGKLISWELISWELISWELISWELISWELISWELISRDDPKCRTALVVVEGYHLWTVSQPTSFKHYWCVESFCLVQQGDLPVGPSIQANCP